jgi:hypothetical protein
MFDLEAFQHINAMRGRRWHQGDTSQWTPLEWAGAVTGESGEMTESLLELTLLGLAIFSKAGNAANAAKKLRRLDLHLPNREAGILKSDVDKLKKQVAKECADTIIYSLLLMNEMGVSAADTIAEVFDQKSVEYGFPERARDTPEKSNWAEFLEVRRDLIEKWRQEGKSCTEIAGILSMDAGQVYLISRVEAGNVPEDARAVLKGDVKRVYELGREGKL